MEEKDNFDSIRNGTVEYDPELDKYEGQVLFPEKLALAKKQLKNVKLPEIEKYEEKSSD